MLSEIRFKFASSTKPLNVPDILVWKRWLKPPAINSHLFYMRPAGIIKHESFDKWLKPALAEECEFSLRRVTILESKIFERFLRVQPTRPKYFVLIPPKSHKLFFGIPQAVISENIRLEEQVCSVTAYDIAIDFHVYDKDLLPSDFNNHVIDKSGIYLFSDTSVSDNLLPSSKDTVLLNKDFILRYFFTRTDVSDNLAEITPSAGNLLKLDKIAFSPQAFKLKYLTFLKHLTFNSEFGIYEYPQQKVVLKDLINLLKPFSQGLRIKNAGFQGFPVNSLEKVSISKNLLDTEIEYCLTLGRNYIGEDMVQNFPDIKIISEDPDTIPVLSPPALPDAEDNSQSNDLFDFQDRGVNQLINNSFTLLSDESGLGMPVQASIALQHLARKRKINSALIICNRFGTEKEHSFSAEGSTEGWLAHLNTWAPELISIVLSPEDEKRIIEWKTPANVYIVSYESLLRDDAAEIINQDLLGQFDCIILDNYISLGKIQYQKEKVFRKFKLSYLWVLDNSPTEEFDNNTISSFIDTMTFFTGLTPNNSNGNEPETIGELTKRIPFKDVRNKNPKKNEFLQRISRNKWFKLNEEQQRDYSNALEYGRSKLNNSIERGNLFVIRPQIFSILHELLQILNLPSSGNASDKAIVLLEEVGKICGHGQKAVIFSQYEKYGLKKLEELFHEQKIRFVTYRAGMNNTALENACQSFRTNKDIHIFLADIKAINKNLNLGDFNQIIHFDQWWNPVSLWLAEDKICGNNNKHVLVQHYRTTNTIEEKIYDKMLEKGLLNKLIVESFSLTAVADMVSTKEWFEFFELDIKDSLSDEPVIDLKSVVNSIKECSFLNFQSMINSFLTKTGFIMLNELDSNTSKNVISLEASKIINGKEECILIRIYHNEIVQDEDVIEFLENISGQNNYSKGLLITNGEFSYGSSKYGAVKINLLTLIDANHLASYLVNFKIL